MRKVSLQTNKLTQRLTHKIEVSENEEVIFLTVDYMEGRFIIEKHFENNYFGLNEFEKARNKFDTEDKVSKYLGLGEKNE